MELKIRIEKDLDFSFYRKEYEERIADIKVIVNNDIHYKQVLDALQKYDYQDRIYELTRLRNELLTLKPLDQCTLMKTGNN